MKKLLLGTIGLVALSGSAMAADLPARPYKAPPPVVVAPIYDWTGFYIGANGGWGRSHSCLDFTNPTVLVINTGTFSDGCATRSGGLVGGQLGYRWQMGAAVFGLEAQGDWANLSSSRVSLLSNIIGAPLTTNVKVDGIGLFTGQIGYTWGAGLLYVKGGGAVTDTVASLNSTVFGTNVTSASATRWGATLGVGFEYLFSPNWSAGVEYNHLWMGTNNNSFSCPLACNAFFVNNVINDRVRQDLDLVTLRLNYKFGAPGAVVAKY